MSENVEVPLSFSSGEDHVNHETRIPSGFARRVVNWDLDNSGVATQARAVGAPTLAGDAHSLWVSPGSQAVYGVVANVLRRVDAGAVVHWEDSGGEVHLPSDARVYYHELNGDVYFSDGERHGIVRPGGVARPWGVANPVNGVRVEGGDVRYLTYEDQWGRESGAVRFDSGAPPYLPGRVARLYWATQDSTKYLLGGHGRELRTRSLVQFPPGRFVSSVGGRMLTVRGASLYYSDPFNPGLIDPRHHYLSLGSRITAMAPVDDGVYVATESEVVFLSGLDPEAWTLERSHGKGVLSGGVCAVPPTLLPDDVAAQDRGVGRHAVAMLTEDGIVFGLSSGRTVVPNKGRVRLPRGVEVRMDVVQRNGYYQLVAIPQGTVASAGAADLPIEPIEVDDEPE